MKVLAMHPNFIMPARSTELAGGYDIFMPTGGHITYGTNEGVMTPLGFTAEVPEGHVALLLPRSGVGIRHGLSLNNTCGVIDADYRGEWMASLRVHNPGTTIAWGAGDRLLQFLLVPVATPTLVEETEGLSYTARVGGFGSTGK